MSQAAEFRCLVEAEKDVWEFNMIFNTVTEAAQKGDPLGQFHLATKLLISRVFPSCSQSQLWKCQSTWQWNWVGALSVLIISLLLILPIHARKASLEGLPFVGHSTKVHFFLSEFVPFWLVPDFMSFPFLRLPSHSISKFYLLVLTHNLSFVLSTVDVMLHYSKHLSIECYFIPILCWRPYKLCSKEEQ